MDDPLDFIDLADILTHGDPARWIFKGKKPGSPTPANSPGGCSGYNETL